jgi:uncharacterized protein YoxC
MSNTLEAIHLLEKTLQNLLSNYEFLKHENEILLQKNTNLHHQLLETKQRLQNQKKRI